MSDTVILALAAAVPLALAGAFLYYGSRIRKRLRPKEASRLLYEIELLNSKSDSERLVGYDKVLDHLLSFLGYSGTLGEKLKKQPKILNHYLDEVWKLHKIRNRLVHDLEPVSGIELHADRYRKILLTILTDG